MCESECIATDDTLSDNVAIVVSESGAQYRERFSTFSLAIHKDEWILSSPKRFSNLGECYHYRFNSYKFDTTCFDDDNACSNSFCSKKGTILHKASTKR
jgi:hypothetical protein